MKTKNKHKYNEDLESFLVMMEADEFIEWLEENEIEYTNPDLLGLILADKKLDEEKKLC